MFSPAMSWLARFMFVLTLFDRSVVSVTTVNRSLIWLYVSVTGRVLQWAQVRIRLLPYCGCSWVLPFEKV